MSKRGGALALAVSDSVEQTVDEKLARIDRERASARAELASLPGREVILLERDGHDDEFSALDRVKRRAEIALARLDVKERAILQQAREEHEADVAAAWAEQRELYQAAAGLFIAAVQEAQRLEARLLEVAQTIHASGTGQTVPAPVRVVADLALLAFTQQIDSMAAQPTVVPPDAERHELVLITHHGALNAGERILVTSAEGWSLIDAGVARWARRAKPPRRPVGLQSTMTGA